MGEGRGGTLTHYRAHVTEGRLYYAYAAYVIIKRHLLKPTRHGVPYLHTHNQSSKVIFNSSCMVSASRLHGNITQVIIDYYNQNNYR